MRIFLNLWTSALWLFYVCANPPSGDLSGAALEVPSEALLHPESTVAKCRPYFRSLTIYVKKGYTQSSTINTSLSIELERVLNSEWDRYLSFFTYVVRFSCVCAFFVVPLQKISTAQWRLVVHTTAWRSICLLWNAATVRCCHVWRIMSRLPWR